MQFNDPTNRTGLIQDCEKWTNLGDAAISGDAVLLSMFTADINNAYDEVMPLILASDAKWQWDDPNHTDYPIACTDLEANQQDYSFVADEQENSVLEITAVYVMDQNGIFQKMEAVDSQSDPDTKAIFAQNAGNTGVPRRYDKLATSLFLDPVPNYGMSGGVKVMFSRAQSYFSSTDTTKTPGIPTPFHRLLALIPSRDYVAIHKSDNAALLSIINSKISEQKANFSGFLSKRAKDERTILRGRVESSR